MKTKLSILIAHLVVLLFSATATYAQDNTPPAAPRTLVAYFSWSGNTQTVAEEIARLTGGTLFRIETATPYPEDYTACTEVAKEELEKGIRPKLKETVGHFERYDTIFVGCPVWWHTAPMAVQAFLEYDGYDFTGKTVVPFCTYAATYRDETLARLVELSPAARHLEGFGARNNDTSGVEGWLKKIGAVRQTEK